MMNHIICLNCGGSMKYPDAYAGKRAKCPKCAYAFRLPAPARLPLPDEEAVDPREAFRGLDRRAAGRRW
jgi:hypothetical protein